MDNIYIIAGCVSIIFFLFKFFEMKYIEQEIKPLKTLIRDSVITYICVIFGGFIIDQFIGNFSANATILTPVFTGEPDF